LALSIERIGTVLTAQGNLPAALESFRVTLAVRERLAKVDPTNAAWQRSLSVSHEKIGLVLQLQGNLSGALESYRIAQAKLRTPRQVGSWQPRVAARPLRVAQSGRPRTSDSG
jgi:hypothetical protein